MFKKEFHSSTASRILHVRSFQPSELRTVFGVNKFLNRKQKVFVLLVTRSTSFLPLFYCSLQMFIFM